MNKCILMGRLTRDPELRHTANNTPVTTFSLAVNRPQRSEDGQQTADYIDIVAWQSRAEFAAKYFRKGQLVAVCGKLQSRKWQDTNGNTRTAFEVVADELHFAESKRESDSGYGGQSYGQNNYGGQTYARPTAVQTPVQNYAAPLAGYEQTGFDEMLGDGDTLPF